MSGGAGGSGGTGGKPNNCTKLPANLLLTDFSPATIRGVADGTSWKASKSDFWGNGTSLTGGDVFYQGKAASAPTVKLQGETLTITASIEPGDYAGYMFNFKPACTNASTTQGLRFDVKPDSSLGNATLKVQMQQKSDYPSTANPNGRPGNCVPTSVDTQYSECLSPATTVVSSGSPITAGTVELPWTLFSGGVPVSNVDNSELMAIQWQFECPSSGGGVVALADVVTGGAGGGDAGGSSGAGTAGGGTGGTSTGGADTAGGSSVAGSAGAVGGTGGAGPVGGTGGTGGDLGTAGTAGSSAGSGGSTTGGSGTGGSSGAAGSSGSAGSGGTSGTPSPCVVSIVIDNVTFY